jgi:site-specific DNA-methyltransferase (adenine-specific)
MNQIILGDCLVELKKIEGTSVDLIITDPPYNMNYSGRGKLNHFDGFANDNLTQGEHTAWFDMCLKEFYRVLKNDSAIYIYIDFRNYARIYNVVAKYFDIKNCIVWDKCSIGMGQSYRFQHEFVIYAVKGKPKLHFVKKNIPDIFRVKRVGGKYKHPTQKPVNIIKPFIEYSSLPNDIILDAFAGSGSTALACVELGRRYIVIEQDPKYVEIIKERTTPVV